MARRGLGRCRGVEPGRAGRVGQGSRDELRFRRGVGLCFRPAQGRLRAAAQLRSPLPHAWDRGPQRPPDEAYKWRQCVVESVAQCPSTWPVAGCSRPRGRDRLCLGPDCGQDAAKRRRDRVRRCAQSRWRSRDANHRRSAGRAAPRRADDPPACRESPQRCHRGAGQGKPARHLSARLRRRTALLDARRIGRRQGWRADRRGCGDRARQGQLFDRPGSNRWRPTLRLDQRRRWPTAR